MKPAEALLPRLFAAILLLVSLSMLVPLAFAVVALVHGAAIPQVRWLLPLTILAIGSGLIWLLRRRSVPMSLFALAFALWLLASGYYWLSALR